MIIDYISDLLPCPFCLGKNLRISKVPLIDKKCETFTMHDAAVYCQDCGAAGPKRAYVDDVKKAWNERKWSQ